MRRLYLRRWLMMACGLILLGLVIVDDLGLVSAIVGFALMAASAALLPREGALRPVRLVSRASEREELTRRLVALLDGLPAPAILLTARGQVWSFNLQAKEFMEGLREGQHISATMRDPRLLEAVAAAPHISQRRQVVPMEERVPIERRLEATLSFIATPGEPSNRGPAILLFMRDLTEQERLGRMRSDFITNASHELRTPLTSVLGFIETLRGPAKADPNAQQRFLGIMAQQAERMARLIDNLLSLSRVEMHQHLRPQGLVDLEDTIHDVMASLDPVAASEGITLHAEGLDGPAMVMGDRDELVQVLSNLVHNAVKYGHSGGNIWIGLALEDVSGEKPRYAVSVRDDGPGIAAEHLPRLTERFYRAHGNGGEKAGTGLGLAIVEHVISRHRGDLRIVSAPGEGATFTVLLEAAPLAGRTV